MIIHAIGDNIDQFIEDCNNDPMFEITCYENLRNILLENNSKAITWNISNLSAHLENLAIRDGLIEDMLEDNKRRSLFTWWNNNVDALKELDDRRKAAMLALITAAFMLNREGDKAYDSVHKANHYAALADESTNASIIGLMKLGLDAGEQRGELHVIPSIFIKSITDCRDLENVRVKHPDQSAKVSGPKDLVRYILKSKYANEKNKMIATLVDPNTNNIMWFNAINVYGEYTAEEMRTTADFMKVMAANPELKAAFVIYESESYVKSSDLWEAQNRLHAVWGTQLNDDNILDIIIWNDNVGTSEMCDELCGCPFDLED